MTGLTNTQMTPVEAIKIRQNAYCLIYGISPNEMKNTYVLDYDFVLNKAKERMRKHNDDPLNCSC